jgi:ABC-type cobalamin/Fe3+-siderophores transport system ATPase subunit
VSWSLNAHALAMRERRHYLLEPTTLAVSTGEVLIAAGDPGHGHTVLALALAGRFHGNEGTVLINGSANEKELQRRVALVDVPGVSEPDPSLPVGTIIGEELAIGGHKANKSAVRGLLTDLGLLEFEHVRVEDLDAGPRLAIGARLAATRPDVRFIVAVLPERNGGLADTWLPMLHGLANTGVGIIVTASIGLAPHLGAERVITFGNAVEESAQ